MKEGEDYPYQQGLAAGKLGRERGILEEKKKELELQMRQKNRQKEKVQKEIDDANDIFLSRATTIQYP